MKYKRDDGYNDDCETCTKDGANQIRPEHKAQGDKPLGGHSRCQPADASC